MNNAREHSPAQNVDEYLNDLPPDIKRSLSELRKIIIAAAPEAEEVTSYQIPTYKHFGPVVHFAAFRDHCSFVVARKELVKEFAQELKSFKTSGTTIHFTPAHPLPADLVKKIVRIRISQNEALDQVKRLAQKKKKGSAEGPTTKKNSAKKV